MKPHTIHQTELVPNGIHKTIVDYILSCNIDIRYVSEQEYSDIYYGDFKGLDWRKDTIRIIVYRQEEDTDIISGISTDLIFDMAEKKLKLNIEHIDSYGGFIYDGCEVLNNYDSSFEQDYSDNGYCDVLGFVSIKDSIVRFTYIVYSFLEKKLIIKEDLAFKFPFKLKPHTIGGKRAVYYDEGKLSLRLRENIYNKVNKKHHQPNSHKDDLTYPRIILYKND